MMPKLLMPYRPITVIEKSEHKLVVEWKAKYKSDCRPMHTEWFALPAPHEEKRVNFLLFNDTDGISLKVQLALTSEDLSSVTSDLHCTMQWFKDGQQVRDFELQAFTTLAGCHLGHEDITNEEADRVYRHASNCSVTLRFTAISKVHNNYAEEDGECSAMLSALFESGPPENIALQVDGKEISVIKQIVELRSPVFMAMLEAKMKEGETKTVDIDDTSYAAMTAFAKFLYCGNIQFLNLSFAFDMIYLADKYDVPKLMQFARTFIATSLAIENVLEVIELADRHSVKDLEDAALDFAVANREVLKSDKYTTFLKNQSAAYKLLAHLMTTQQLKHVSYVN